MSVTKRLDVPHPTIAGLSQPTDVVIPDNMNPGTVKDGLTALAGGAQAGTALSAMINRVTTVTSAADSVQLPVSVAGLRVVVINAAAANAMAVFPQTGDAINALSANTALSVAANKTVEFICTAAGRWHSNLTA